MPDIEVSEDWSDEIVGDFSNRVLDEIPNADYELIQDPAEEGFPNPEDQPGFDPERPYNHKTWLFREFKVLGKSAQTIADEYNVSKKLIQIKLNEYQIVE